MITLRLLFLAVFTDLALSARKEDEQQVHLGKNGSSKDVEANPAEVDAAALHSEADDVNATESRPETEPLDQRVYSEPQPELRPATREGPIIWMTDPRKCLDVTGGSSRNGNHIGLFDCLDVDVPAHANQQFIPPAGGKGPLRWSARPNKCLDVAGGEDFNGNNIGIFDCLRNGTHPNQQFVLPANGVGSIRWATHLNKCMDVMGGGHLNGNKIGIFDCLQNGTHANMQFGFPQLSAEIHAVFRVAPAIQRHTRPAPSRKESMSEAPEKPSSSDFGMPMHWIEEHLHLHAKAHGIEQQLQDDALYWGALGGLFVQVGLSLGVGATYVIWLLSSRKSKDT